MVLFTRRPCFSGKIVSWYEVFWRNLRKNLKQAAVYMCLDLKESSKLAYISVSLLYQIHGLWLNSRRYLSSLHGSPVVSHSVSETEVLLVLPVDILTEQRELSVLIVFRAVGSTGILEGFLP